MSHRSRITPRAAAARAVALAVVGIFAFGAQASADDAVPPTDSSVPEEPVVPAEPVVAASSSVTLPLFGAPLVVDINVDPGGNLVDVALNQPGDFTATTVKPNKVMFVNEVEGVSVKVKAKHGGERIEARAADLADVSGPGQWSGDIFDNGQATVDFTVGAREDGSPDITGVTVTSPFEFTIGETNYDSGDKHGGEHARASVAIEFSDSGQTRSLRISVALRTSEDHTSAKLSIGLSRVKGAEIPDGPAIGTHTWSGMLCDGTNATITYTVGEDGTIADVTASPEGAEISTSNHGVKVRFATGERVRIKVRDSDGQLQVGADDRIRCDAADPSVNTPVDPDADTGGDGHHGDGNGRGHGDGSKDGAARGDGEGRGDHRHDSGDD